MKYYFFLIASILFFLLCFYKFAEKNTEAKIEKKQQEQQIQIRNEIIEVKKSVEKRKIINRQVDTNANLSWLRQKRCSDCDS